MRYLYSVNYKDILVYPCTGRGESYLLLIKQALQQNFDGKAVDLVSLALGDLVKAVKLRPQFTCLWKLIGDCLTSLHGLAEDIARPRVPKVLCGENPPSPDEWQIIDKKETLYIGCRAYANAIQLNPESALFWHDLAVGYLYLGQAVKKEDPERKENFTNAVNAIKKAISLDAQNHYLWNTFGVIVATPEINSPSLAQHAFIKSIQEERNNATAWANLGALYLTHDNMKLAHEAFKNAQSIAPDCVEAWIGQAMIAENIGDSEAMDLFRHSTELGYHPQGSVGYGYWVCQSLGTIDPKLILVPGQGTLNSIALTGMLQARDCLQKCALREKDDACALNYLGLLYEQEGLIKEAEKAFSSALKAVSSNDSKAVCMIKDNYARVLSAQGKLSEALEHLQALPLEDDITFQFELALALYRKLKLAESGQVYQLLFDKLSKTTDDGIDNSKSTVLTAQAMVAFAQGNHDNCKQFLFKAFQTPPVSVHGLVALCALGCVTSNLTLIQAALMEIDKLLEWATEVLHPSSIDVLNVILFILQENSQAQECVKTLKGILGRLPSTSSNECMPLPLPLMLHALKRSSADKATLRAAVLKLVHAYPTDVWTLAMLTSLLEQAQDLKVKYHQLVILHIEGNLSQLSAKEVQSPVDKSYQASLLSLQQWAAAT